MILRPSSIEKNLLPLFKFIDWSICILLSLIYVVVVLLTEPTPQSLQYGWSGNFITPYANLLHRISSSLKNREACGAYATEKRIELLYWDMVNSVSDLLDSSRLWYWLQTYGSLTSPTGLDGSIRAVPSALFKHDNWLNCSVHKSVLRHDAGMKALFGRYNTRGRISPCRLY